MQEKYYPREPLWKFCRRQDARPGPPAWQTRLRQALPDGTGRTGLQWLTGNPFSVLFRGLFSCQTLALVLQW